MADAKIINYGQQISAGTTAIPDNSATALDIESVAGEEFIIADTATPKLTLKAGGNATQDVEIDGNGNLSGSNGQYSLRASAASATSPNIVPDNGDLDTGIGSADNDQLSLIAGGVERARLYNKGVTITGYGGTTGASPNEAEDVALYIENGTANSTNACVVELNADGTSGSQVWFSASDTLKGYVGYSNNKMLLHTNAATADISLAANYVERLNIDAGTGATKITGPLSTVGLVATALTDSGGTASVSTSGSSTALVGVNTAFTTDFHVGAAIKVGSVITTVTAITDDNNLTLEDAINTSSTGTTCTRDSGELFAVKTGDSKSILSVNATGVLGLSTEPDAGTTTGSGNNLGIGDPNMFDNVTTMNRMTVIGNCRSNQTHQFVTGDSCVIMGWEAGKTSTAVQNSVLIGSAAGDGGTGINQAVVVGQGAGRTSGNYGVHLGFQAGAAATGAYNVSVGSNAMMVNGPANSVAIGYQANRQGTGTRNVAVGDNALQQSGGASQCVSVGYQSGLSATGNSQTFLGYEAGNAITSGAENVIIGHSADGTADVDNQIVIGYNAASNGVNTVTLGNSSISGLHCQVQSISALSDSRVKDNVQDSALGLDFINALRPVKYEKKHGADWPEEFKETRFFEKTETHTRELEDGTTEEYQVTIPATGKPSDWQPKTEYGLIAQEVKAAMESHNATDWQGHKTLPNGSQALGYGDLVTVLVKAVQELTARIATLEAGD